MELNRSCYGCANAFFGIIRTWWFSTTVQSAEDSRKRRRPGNAAGASMTGITMKHSERRLFDFLIRKLQKTGPLRIDAVKTSINLSSRHHFGGITVRRGIPALGIPGPKADRQRENCAP